MNILELSSLKRALEFVRDAEKVDTYPSGPKKGLIDAPKDFSKTDSYALFIAQRFEPKLITQPFAGTFVLTLEGQELLDIIADDVYVNSIREDLASLGYTSPSDRQVFRELRRRMDVVDFSPKAKSLDVREVFTQFFEAAQNTKLVAPTAFDAIAAKNVEPADAIQESAAEESAELEVLDPKASLESVTQNNSSSNSFRDKGKRKERN